MRRSIAIPLFEAAHKRLSEGPPSEAHLLARTLLPALTGVVSRQARVDRTVRFSVPRNFPPGPAFLLVGSAGGINDPTPLDQKFQTLVALQGTTVGAASSLTEAVDQFEDLGKNTEILVTLVPAPVMQALGLNANPAFIPAGTVLPTDWVVLGRFQIPMVVK